jgi:ABC-type nitrate/sulfonate/bicarbonate transport system ATPase subunit
MREPVLSVRGVAKTFQGEEESCPALAGITFDVAPHEIVCIMGPSGCGKSTLLRIIGGLEHADTGSILGGGASAAMVFQEHALFPWLSVRDNIVYGLHLAAQKVPEEEVDSRLTGLLTLTHLTAFARSLPHQLSGGMKQRAAVARALAVKPSILLMDEPFSALDVFTRRELEDSLLRIREELATTILMVTHNPDEAVYLADRIIVLSGRPGAIVEILKVEIPHPRNPASLEYIRIREQVTRMVQGKPDQDR